MATIKQINTETWKQTDLLLYLDEGGGCCGCTLHTYYMMDAAGKFDIIFTTEDYLNDAEDSEGRQPQHLASRAALFWKTERLCCYNKIIYSLKQRYHL